MACCYLLLLFVLLSAFSRDDTVRSGEGEECLLCGPGSELRKGRSWRKYFLQFTLGFSIASRPKTLDKIEGISCFIDVVFLFALGRRAVLSYPVHWHSICLLRLVHHYLFGFSVSVCDHVICISLG